MESVENLDVLINKLFARKEKLTDEEKRAIIAILPQKAKQLNLYSKFLAGAGLVDLLMRPFRNNIINYINALAITAAYGAAILLSDEAHRYVAYAGSKGILEQEIVSFELDKNAKMSNVARDEISRRVSKYYVYLGVGLPTAVAAVAVSYAIGDYTLVNTAPFIGGAVLLVGAVCSRIRKYSRLSKRC